MYSKEKSYEKRNKRYYVILKSKGAVKWEFYVWIHLSKAQSHTSWSYNDHSSNLMRARNRLAKSWFFFYVLFLLLFWTTRESNTHTHIFRCCMKYVIIFIIILSVQWQSSSPPLETTNDSLLNSTQSNRNNLMPNYGVVIKIKEAKPKMSGKKNQRKKTWKLKAELLRLKNTYTNAHTAHNLRSKEWERESEREIEWKTNERK